MLKSRHFGQLWGWQPCRPLDAPGINGGFTHRQVTRSRRDRWGRGLLWSVDDSIRPAVFQLPKGEAARLTARTVVEPPTSKKLLQRVRCSTISQSLALVSEVRSEAKSMREPRRYSTRCNSIQGPSHAPSCAGVLFPFLFSEQVLRCCSRSWKDFAWLKMSAGRQRGQSNLP